MKFIVKTLVSWATVSVGCKAGEWLWNEVLESKAENLKERLIKKEKAAV